MLYRNVGIRTKYPSINYTWAFICILIRVTMLCCITFYVVPLVWLLIVESWAINNQNYWRQSNDSLITKIASLNGVICWIIWLGIIFIYILVFIYIPFFFFGIIYIFCKVGFGGVYIIFKIILNIIFVRFISYMLGNPAEFNSILNCIKENLSSERYVNIEDIKEKKN